MKKEQAMQKLPSIKDELPSLFFPQYRIMQDFTSDDEETNRLDGKRENSLS